MFDFLMASRVQVAYGWHTQYRLYFIKITEFSDNVFPYLVPGCMAYVLGYAHRKYSMLPVHPD